MDALIVQQIALPYKYSPDGIQEMFLPLPDIALDQLSWNTFGYKPKVFFKIAHTRDGILLQFDVMEHHVKAVYRQTNDPVYKDSCVEFFISFDGRYYYNLEFNCLGTALVGYGTKNKQERIRLPEPLIGLIKTNSKINARSNDSTLTHWQLNLYIPVEVFCYEQISSLAGVVGSANFYKCGDDLSVPHYVSWKKIESELPNFHLPDFFGILIFE
ncbi:Carbohydrate-binding family 9 [bacterium A37T11]|nr:Carbohydrate-binding family 9 [bacterium A37T11]